MRDNTYLLLLNTISDLENGKNTAERDSRWCAETISRLWDQKKITGEEVDILCNRVIELNHSTRN